MASNESSGYWLPDWCWVVEGPPTVDRLYGKSEEEEEEEEGPRGSMMVACVGVPCFVFFFF